MAQSQNQVINQADSLMALGNYSKAIEIYLSQDLDDKICYKIANAYTALGNYDAALNNYKKAIDFNPDDILLKYEYAKMLSKTKKFKEASLAFDELINLDYRNPNYHYEKGLVLEQLKDSTAYDRFWSAFQLDSTHQKAIYKLAKHQLKLKNFQSVHNYADKGLLQYKNNKELISVKAQAYYWDDEYEKAIYWFEKLLDLNEESAFIYEKLSFCYVQNSDYNDAIKYLKKALEIEPKNATNLYILGQLYERNNDFENAEKYITESLKLQDVPLDNEYTKLGLVLNRQHKYQEAIEAFKKAIKENPNTIETHFYLANTKDKFYEDIDARIKAYQDFIDRFPNSPFASFSKSKIEALKKEKFLKED